ncbi:type VII secretion target [Kitasatospora sp. NPDC002227]|uniref:type VII secretion target n=1 Tax=Kitasatospora sp. NPDC002227 TaxID=3154773 RepID=UPI0033178301
MPVQGGSAGFRVHPDELQAAGQTAGGLAGQVLDELRGVLGPSDQTVGVLRGCQTGTALNECTEAWRTLLTDLSAEMDRSGRNLVQSARAYQVADSDAAARTMASARG